MIIVPLFTSFFHSKHGIFIEAKETHEFLTLSQEFLYFGFNWLFGEVDGIESFTKPLFELYFFILSPFIVLLLLLSGTNNSPFPIF